MHASRARRPLLPVPAIVLACALLAPVVGCSGGGVEVPAVPAAPAVVVVEESVDADVTETVTLDEPEGVVVRYAPPEVKRGGPADEW